MNLLYPTEMMRTFFWVTFIIPFSFRLCIRTHTSCMFYLHLVTYSLKYTARHRDIDMAWYTDASDASLMLSLSYKSPHFIIHSVHVTNAKGVRESSNRFQY